MGPGLWDLSPARGQGRFPSNLRSQLNPPSPPLCRHSQDLPASNCPRWPQPPAHPAQPAIAAGHRAPMGLLLLDSNWGL